MPRGIADERDSADRTVTPTGNKTKMNGFVEISTLLIHSAPKQKSNEWMHLSPFYTRMHGEWLRYAKSTSQFHWRFLLVRDVRGFQVNPLCRHDITRSDRQIGNYLNSSWHRFNKVLEKFIRYFGPYWHDTLRSCCRFVGCKSMMLISRSTTSQRCSIGLRSGDCGGYLSKENSLTCSRNQSEMIWALWHGALYC